MDNKAPEAFRSISEVASDLDLPQHVLRFWESRFHEIRPMKRGGGRRYYRPEDVNLLRGIRHLLYGEGYTIRGVQRILRDEGPKFVQSVWQEGAPQPPHGRIEDDEIAEDTEDAEAANAEAADETRGLGSRLSALIGRDLGDREDDAAARHDPPLEAMPEPRIDAMDRAIHGVASAPATPATHPRPASAQVTGGDLQKLQAVLQELGECRKLIDAVLTPAG